MQRARLLALLTSVGCTDAPFDEPAISDISLAPLALSPTFSPKIHDYTVYCGEGTTSVTLAISDGTGERTSSLALTENQLVDVGDYHIRCLPHDFPELATTQHGKYAPTSPGWYLINGGAFAMILDQWGTPVWYRRGSRVVHVTSLAPNTVSYVPDSDQAPFTISTTPTFQTLAIDSGELTLIKAVGLSTDVHELQRLSDGSHVLLSYPLVPHVDLTGLGTFGADETIADCVIQVIDPAGAIAWSWHAIDHIDPVAETRHPQVNVVSGVNVVDVFHCNAVEADGDGTFITSIRHADAAYAIDRSTGAIRWKLGGTEAVRDGAAHLAIVDDPAMAFSMQHDVRLLPNGHVTLFDNHGPTGTPGVARGVEYALDLSANTATFVAQWPGIGVSGHQGSFRSYDDGARVVGWGGLPNERRAVTEYDASGNITLEISMPGLVTYRAIKYPLAQFDIEQLRGSAGQ